MLKKTGIFCLAMAVSLPGSIAIPSVANATSFDPVKFCRENAAFFGSFERCLEEVTFEGPEGNEYQPPSNRPPSDKDNHCSGRISCPR